MNEKPEAGAVILGGDFLGLGIIRCLSEHQIPCFLVDYEFSISRFSRMYKDKPQTGAYWNGVTLRII